MTDALHDEDEPLIPVAGRIADGLPVDWEHERGLATDEDRSALDALRDIAQIEAAHREAQLSFEPPGADAEPTGWRHLTILETIGSGRFGYVNRAFDNTLQIEVALKLSALHPSVPFDASEALREARQLAKVRHPNVVRVYGADYSDGRAGIWMDLVKGQTLDAMVKTHRFGAAEAANVGIQLCRALAAVHGEGVLHGDIKPHNVIRRENGDFVLVDFGASTSIPDAGDCSRDLVGTLVYVAPEVLEGAPRSRTSDIYALGVLLFKLVTDTYPIFATSVDGALKAHRDGRPQRLRDLRPDLPASFIEVVERATAPDPARRFASAAGMEAALLDKAPPAPPPLPISWRGVIATALIAALGLGAWTIWSTRGTTRVEPRLTSEGTGAAKPEGTFTIEASFRRLSPSGEEKLDTAKALRLDDQFYLTARLSAPTHVYVVDEDEAGKAFLLFPLARDPQTNPLPANQAVRVPASYNWKVDSVGGREHLLVFASPTPLAAFDEAFSRLPAPTVSGQADAAQPLPPEVLEHLRGVGKLAPATSVASDPLPTFWRAFQKPLAAGPETVAVAEFWARQLTLENRGAGK